MKYWEMIADKLSRDGWTWVTTIIHAQHGRLFVVDAHRDDGRRFIARAALIFAFNRGRPKPCAALFFSD